MMHCTSTTMTSTAPVSTASSWWRKLPAGGMPKRMRISLAVQQMPARLMPSAPLALASAISSGSRDGLDHHRRQRRLVAVDDDVDLVGLEHPEVDLGGQRGGRAEEDVGDVGREHGAAPAVGERTAQGALEDVLGVQIDALVGAVHDLGDLAVDGPRGEAELAPQGLPFGGGALGVDDLAMLLAELEERDFGDLDGDVVGLASGRRHAEMAGHHAELLLVANGIVGRRAARRRQQGVSHVAAVVGVGRHAAGHLAREVTRSDRRPVGAANAGLVVGVLPE